MMAQIAPCVALQLVEDAKLAQLVEVQASEFIVQTRAENTGSIAAEALLPTEEEEAARDRAEGDRQTFSPSILKRFRYGYGEHAIQVADEIKQLVVTSAEGILRKARLVFNMKLHLNRKEWGVWLREKLGWFGNEATPYLQIAKMFKDFEPAVFRELEPFTILKLRTKRYAPIVARLREELAITSYVVQNLIKEVIPKQSRQKKAAPKYGEAVLKQRLNAEDGTSYFTLNANLGNNPGSWLESKLKERTVGQVLEQAAAWEQHSKEHRHNMREGLEVEVEHRVHNRIEMAEFALKREIAELKAQLQANANPSELVKQPDGYTAHQSPKQEEALALPAYHKLELTQPDDYRTIQTEEQRQMVHDVRSCNTTAVGGSLSPETTSLGQELQETERDDPKFEEKAPDSVVAFEDEVAIALNGKSENLEAQVKDLAPEETAEYGVEANEAIDSEQEQVLQAGDLVEINVISPNGDKTWNGLSGYVQKVVVATGKAVVLLQGDYRSKHFFLNELKLVHEDLSDAMQARVPQKELVEEASTTMTQLAITPEAVESVAQPEASDDASSAKYQPLVADWDVFKQLRDAESSLQKIDAQIQTINSNLAKPDSGEIVKRELSPVLQKQQNLRSAKISEMVELVDNSGISAYYEERHNIGRVVLEPKYASVALLQAKSWAEVVLVVGGSSTQLIKAIQSWSMESKQLLAQLLSEYLEEPNAFKQIDWIPEDLLLLALAKLSFQLQRFKKTDNLVDEPEIEYLTGCQLSSFSHLGTRREQWVFLFEGNLIPVFGRDEFLVEKL